MSRLRSAMQGELPKVSVVIPTKNRRALLEETLLSIESQEFSAWEALVVDDGSGDETQTLVETLRSADPRFHYLPRSGPAGGACACRNQGAEAARGDYVIFLDSDDLLAPWCLEQRVAAMDSNPALDFAVFPCERFLQEPGDIGEPFKRDTLEGDLDRYLAWDVPWQTASAIWRRASLGKTGGWDPELPSAQDLDFYIRALVNGSRYLRFPGTDCYWRVDQNIESITTFLFSDDNHLKALAQTFCKWRDLLQAADLLSDSRRLAIAGLYFLLAEKWTRKGRYEEARAAWDQVQTHGIASRSLHREGRCVLFAYSRTPAKPLLRRWVCRWLRARRLRR